MRKLRKYYWKALKVGRLHAAQAHFLTRGYTTRFQRPQLRLGETISFSFFSGLCTACLFTSFYLFDLIFGAAGRVRPRTGCIGIYLGQDFCLFNMGKMLDIALRVIWGDAV